MTNNIFLVLSKYNSAIDENYLTEAFVFVLNSLLERDRDACLKILSNICINNNEFDFLLNEDISITTQDSTELGRPDIKISSSDKLIYIEVKHDSGLGYRQIERYATVLNSSKAKIRKVVLLTRFTVDFEENSEKPYKHIRWFQVYNLLLDIEVKNPINKYLVESFLNFLEVKKMSMQKVTWEYVKGVPAFKDLINMIEVAIESSSLTIYKKSAGWDWMGFYIENNKIFCAVYYDKPLFIRFELYDGNKPEPKISFSLNLETVHFFSLNKDEQLQIITQFIKNSYKEIISKV